MYWYFTWWHDDGTVERIHDALRGKVREADGRNAEPSVGLIDSQSVRTADTVPAATRGFDAGKRVKGRKRFIVTDTLGLLLTVHVVAASIQDRDGAKRSLLWTRLGHPSVKKVWADQGFAGRLVQRAARILAASWRSSAKTLASAVSRSSPSGGWWGGPSPGSPPTGVSPGITRPARPTPRR
ncbi:transposase [Streptomyces sp. NPDC127051]|uniref:transposase n=1 Tax=Streptomyces sp. NPDC127051 TaxID=3347119 RepID=UPI00365A5EFE